MDRSHGFSSSELRSRIYEAKNKCTTTSINHSSTLVADPIFHGESGSVFHVTLPTSAKL